MKKMIIAGALVLTLAGGVAVGSQAALLSQASDRKQPVLSDTTTESKSRLCSESHTHDGEVCSLGTDCPDYELGECSNDDCQVHRHYSDGEYQNSHHDDTDYEHYSDTHHGHYSDTDHEHYSDTNYEHHNDTDHGHYRSAGHGHHS